MGSKKKTTEEFISDAIKVHGEKYIYDEVEYVNNKTKVAIICKKHGKFYQQPIAHLHGQGCKKCVDELKSDTKEKFIEKAMEIHGNAYSYEKVDYKNNKTKVIITCKAHGDFLQTPNDHLNGHGCPKCGNVYRMSKEEFIDNANNVHNFKYDYSKADFINLTTKICVICPKHGEFYQLPTDHLRGYGCSKCNNSSLEREIYEFLSENKIEFEFQKKFDWLGRKSLDFYLPKYKIAIECQGIQHFKEKNGIFDEKTVVETKKRDEMKRELCENNGVKLLYFSNLGINYPYKVYENKDLLLEEIKNG